MPRMGRGLRSGRGARRASSAEAFDDITGELAQFNQKELVLMAWPIMQWTLGTFVVSAAVFFLVIVIKGSMGKTYKGQEEGFWWQYILGAGILSIGLAILGTGKAERVSVSKVTQRIVVTKRGPFHCRSEVRARRKLEELRNITMQTLGRVSADNDNRHYKVALHWRDGQKSLVLESRHKMLCLQRVNMLHEFVFGGTSSGGAGVGMEQARALVAAARAGTAGAARGGAGAGAGAGAGVGAGAAAGSGASGALGAAPAGRSTLVSNARVVGAGVSVAGNDPGGAGAHVGAGAPVSVGVRVRVDEEGDAAHDIDVTSSAVMAGSIGSASMDIEGESASAVGAGGPEADAASIDIDAGAGAGVGAGRVGTV